MKHYLAEWKERIRKWAKDHAEGPRAKFWLGAVSFSEASFFIVPPDVLLIAILLTSAKRWIQYATFTTVMSVLGGAFGYLIGLLLFGLVGEPLITFYNIEEEVETVRQLFEKSAFIAIFTAAFTPIPFKVFTISAGLFHINFIVFIVASLLGRGIRFFAIAGLLHVYGKKITKLLDKYFNVFSLLVTLIFIVGILLFVS